MSYIANNKVRVLSIALALTALGYLAAFFFAVGDGEYAAAHEDETTFINDARLFSETGSVKSAVCINEERARLLECDWYGPFYHLIYGLPTKIFGFGDRLMIIFHVLAVLAAAGLIFLIDMPGTDKRSLALLFLIYPTTIVYSLTYFPESIHLFLSVALLVAMTKIETKHGRVVFILLTVVFALTRVTTMAWILALIPYSKNRGEIGKNILLALGGFALVYFYMYWFMAIPYIESARTLFAPAAALKNMFNSFSANISAICGTHNIPAFTLFFLIGLAATMLYRDFLKHKRELSPSGRVLAAALLVSGATIGIFTVFYTTQPFYFIKQTAFLSPLLLFAVVSSTKNRENRPFRLIVWLLLFISLPYTIKKIDETIYAHKYFHYKRIEQNDIISSFTHIKDFVNQNRESNVLFCYNEFDPPHNLMSASLPYSNWNRHPILYTTNICHPDAPAAEKFRLHGKIDIDFVLSKNRLEELDEQLILKTKYYHLYQLPNYLGKAVK